MEIRVQKRSGGNDTTVLQFRKPTPGEVAQQGYWKISKTQSENLNAICSSMGVRYGDQKLQKQSAVRVWVQTAKRTVCYIKETSNISMADIAGANITLEQLRTEFPCAGAGMFEKAEHL